MTSNRSRTGSSSRWTSARGALWVPLAGLIAGAGALAFSAARPDAPAPTRAPQAAPVPQAINPDNCRLIELPITLDELSVLAVTPNGLAEPAFGERSGCFVLSSHTDASFTGGSYKLQAGFAQNEIFAATYTLTAADFPIKINLAEAIFATSNASQATTTQWSILFWAGTPQTGTLVDTFSSDDIVLPHIHLPAGTAGTNVQFSIDPADPDQIIINDNGTHKFSVGWRIDHHNQPPGNPCTTSPPTCCNAFPVVDVSGLAVGPANWLFGLNCGPGGCPANGGWSTFTNLPGFCRPTGDIVTRTTWSSLACQPGVGPCCLPSGVCQVMISTDCTAQGGVYQGDGTSCSGVNCPIPRGACCFNGGFCINNLSAAECSGAGGSWLGKDVLCNGSQCPTGACCLPSGACLDGVTLSQCQAQSGTFRGVGTTCATSNCPQPTGACCTLSSFCLVLTEVDCAGIPGATWMGPFTTCVDDDEDGRADLCKCLADYDNNTFVNGDDFDFFSFDFFLGLPPADVDHNSFVNGDDFDLFAEHFYSGC